MAAPSYATEFKDFLWYCASDEATAAQKNTVKIMADAVWMDVRDYPCEEIYARLKETKFLNLANGQISDLAPLTEFSQIESLNLAYNLVESTKALGKLANLDQIDLSHNRLTEFPDFKDSPKLTALILSFNPITSLAHTDSLSGLKKLEIDSTHIADLSALAGINLQQLSAQYLRSNANLATLPEMPDLQVLRLDETFALDDLSDFGQYPKLRILSARYSGLTSVAGIADLGELRTLSLEGNAIEHIKDGQLPQHIASLDLSLNPISDFSFLASMPSLERLLNIDNTGFHDWRHVAPVLPKLQYFYAAFTKVKEIRALDGTKWPMLTNMDLGGTEIASLYPLTKVTACKLRNFYGPDFKTKDESVCPTTGVPAGVADYCRWQK